MTKILLRRGTLAQWQAANPILAQGEPAIVLDTAPPILKIGDGETHFLALPPFTVPVNLNVLAPLVFNVTTQTLSLASDLGDVIIDGSNF